MQFVRNLISAVRMHLRRRRYREGSTLSQFIAKDVRRDVQIISAARIDEGYVTARVRTINVFYVAQGFVEEPDFGTAQELRIDELWIWTGQPWGGLSDGTSLADTVKRNTSD